MIEQKLKEARDNFDRLIANQDILNGVATCAELIIHSFRSGHKVLLCGNGGSAADAQHMAGEFLCRFYKDRQSLPAIALTTDSSTLTAIANDYSYEDVFSRQLEALGNKGDVLIGISTSGTSRNVMKAMKVAKDKGIKTVFLTGNRREASEFEGLVDVLLAVPSNDTPRIQEMHLALEHIICEIVEGVFVQ